MGVQICLVDCLSSLLDYNNESIITPQRPKVDKMSSHSELIAKIEYKAKKAELKAAYLRRQANQINIDKLEAERSKSRRLEKELKIAKEALISQAIKLEQKF